MRPTADTLRYIALLLVVTVLGLFAVVFGGSPRAEAADPNWQKYGEVTVRNIVTQDGTKCVLATQGSSQGGNAISCDHSTRRPSP